jgi:segregation and condensation protein A
VTTTPWTPTADTADTGFVVRLDAFSGPLDLLLHLIREQEIEITDIPIAQVADQFLAAIAALGLDEAADYLEMAAMLLRIKIQMLLPRPFDEEDWEDPRAELVRRLLEYEQIREVVDWLAEQSNRHADRFGRGWVPDSPEVPPPPLLLDLRALMEAVEQVIVAMPEPVLHRVVPRPLDVEGAAKRLEALLVEREEVTLLEAIGAEATIADVLSVLLALLELARVGRVRVSQPRPFDSVMIRRESAGTAD